ncbi:type I DNA topoisomerase [Candidatus Dependentiae bacterium]|nr:type I DNA topoisomerase [Candidatus Dependentiae bacterium]
MAEKKTKKKAVAKKTTKKITKRMTRRAGALRQKVAGDVEKLLIVESPAKIKTISKFLGKDVRIMSTFGHIKDLPARKLGVEVDPKSKSITLTYVPIKDKAVVIADICKQASRAKEVYLASDPDREGEIISWHIGGEIEKVIKDPSKIYRITFNEITEPAITQAIQDKSTVDMNLVRAQQARRVLDRWVGYEVSPILWKKIMKGLSAGRVQSVALLLVCTRDEEIVNFKPEESWSIHGVFYMAKTDIEAELVTINGKKCALKNKGEADKVLADAKKQSFIIDKISEKDRLKSSLPPFMTSTLQQDAYNKLGFSVSRTMTIAQKLYEGLPLSDPSKPEALITYMRTDSLRISDTALKETRAFISKNYGEKYLPKVTNVYSKKGAQDAHEAIRPINVEVTPEVAAKYLDSASTKLYSLIWKRFMACQMSKAEYFQRQVSLKGGKYLFRVTGSTLVFDGFLKVYAVEDAESKNVVNIPKDIKEKDDVELKKAAGKQHFTQPPPRYSEATLVKELEKKGVGRPSTYAAILSTIQNRKYVEKDPKVKRFFPTDLGKTVNSLLVKNLPDIINVSFTAHMEEDLDKIADGKIERDNVLNEFYKEFKKDLKEFAGKDGKKEAVKTGLQCPKCKSDLLVRFGKAGQFAGCSGYPECTFTSNFTRDESGAVVLQKQTGTKISSELACPNCGKTLAQKMSKYGPFWACPGYPECKYIHQEVLKMVCPKCQGKLVKRKWRGGSFWGCSGYPKCRFAIFGQVLEEPCPKCKSPYLLVTKGKDESESYSCPDKECGYKK